MEKQEKILETEESPFDRKLFGCLICGNSVEVID